MVKRKKRMSTIRHPMGISRIRKSNLMSFIKIMVLVGSVVAGVLLMLFFGFPLIEDLIRGVDPAARYQSVVEADFTEKEQELYEDELNPQEMYLPGYTIKNDPYMVGEKIIFTTAVDKSEVIQLDSVAIYDTVTEELLFLNNIEKKYDNLLQPMMSGNYAVWLDSLSAGGGRIVGYDLVNEKQFVIKEYGYAQPELSLSGNMLAFMQWAGDETQRLYAYDLSTREAVTVKLYQNIEVGNSAVDISDSDLVWSETSLQDGIVEGTLKRMVIEDGLAKYDNYDMETNVFSPKTNGQDIVFATEQDIVTGDLMLSVAGDTPIKIAENVLNYELGEDFVAYTKDERIYICYTRELNSFPLTSDITKSILANVDDAALTYYDITDGVTADEVVMYAHVH